jgi:hypothetical protein
LQLFAVVMMAMVVLQSIMQSFMHLRKWCLTSEQDALVSGELHSSIEATRSDSFIAEMVVSGSNNPHGFQKIFEMDLLAAFPLHPTKWHLPCLPVAHLIDCGKLNIIVLVGQEKFPWPCTLAVYRLKNKLS